MTHQEEITDVTHRSLASSLFNHTWTLLDKKNRTPEDDIEMMHCAHASRYHWSIVGTPLNFAHEGLARALVTNNPQEALKHITQAKTVGQRIEKDEDRDWLHQNLDDIKKSLDG